MRIFKLSGISIKIIHTGEPNYNIFRLTWENDLCSKSIKHYCNDHYKNLWNGCLAGFYVRCNYIWDSILDNNDLKECFDVVRAWLTSTDQNFKQLNTDFDFKRFKEEFKGFKDTLANIDEKVKYLLCV